MFRYDPKKRNPKESDQDGPSPTVGRETSLSLVELSVTAPFRSGVLSEGFEAAIVRWQGKERPEFRGSAKFYWYETICNTIYGQWNQPNTKHGCQTSVKVLMTEPENQLLDYAFWHQLGLCQDAVIFFKKQLQTREKTFITGQFLAFCNKTLPSAVLPRILSFWVIQWQGYQTVHVFTCFLVLIM